MTRNSFRRVHLDSTSHASIQVRWGISVSLVVEWIVTALLLAVLAAYLVLGMFNRYVADDYSQVLAIRQNGFWVEQIAHYQQWSGRFTSEAAITAAASLTETFIRVLPALLITAWMVALMLAMGQLLPGMRRMIRLLLALGIVYTTIHVTPSTFLSIYWMTGSLTYVLPLIFATALVAILVRPDGNGGHGIPIAVGAASIAFVAGGTSETYVAAQTVALGLAVIAAATPLSTALRRRLRRLVASLLASCAAFAVIAASPGNAIRAAEILPTSGRPSLLELPSLTLHYTNNFFGALVPAHWQELLAVAVLAALLGAQSTAVSSIRSAPLAACAVTIGAVLTIVCAIAPTVYEERQLTPVYGQIVLIYVCVSAIATLGWIGGQCSRVLMDRLWTNLDSTGQIAGVAIAGTALVAGAGLVAGPISTLAAIAHEVPAIHGYAAAKDAQAAAAQTARALREPSVVAPALPDVTNLGVFTHRYVDELTTDPTYWVNHDEAVYFGVHALSSRVKHG